jgi:hypothetical protein
MYRKSEGREVKKWRLEMGAKSRNRALSGGDTKLKI